MRRRRGSSLQRPSWRSHRRLAVLSGAPAPYRIVILPSLRDPAAPLPSRSLLPTRVYALLPRPADTRYPLEPRKRHLVMLHAFIERRQQLTRLGLHDRDVGRAAREARDRGHRFPERDHGDVNVIVGDGASKHRGAAVSLEGCELGSQGEPEEFDVRVGAETRRACRPCACDHR